MPATPPQPAAPAALPAPPSGAGSVAPGPAPPRLAPLLATLPEGPVPLSTLLGALGPRAHGAALLLLALPETVPVPLPSAGAVLGVPILVVALHLLRHGEAARLPQRLLDLRLPLPLVRLLRERGPPLLARVERRSRPRWPALARRERAAGLVAAWLALLLLLPLPAFNVPPAIGLALIGWGLVSGDGLALALGAAVAVGATGAAAWLMAVARDLWPG